MDIVNNAESEVLLSDDVVVDDSLETNDDDILPNNIVREGVSEEVEENASMENATEETVQDSDSGLIDRIKNYFSDEFSSEYDCSNAVITAGSFVASTFVMSQIGNKLCGTPGQLIGTAAGVIGFAYVGPEVIADVEGAHAYCDNMEAAGQEASFVETFGSNLLNFRGQTYSANTIISASESDSEPECM